jgi:hypothetical protein
MWSCIPFYILFLVDIQFTAAIKIPFRVRYNKSNTFARRANGLIPIVNTANAEYISNITLGGRSIPVLLDTGAVSLLYQHIALLFICL